MSKQRSRELEQHPETESLYPIPASTYYYYVQSPPSPFPPHNETEDDNDPHSPTAQPPAFSRCSSSSRGSNRSSFLHEGKELLDAGCGLSLPDGELQRLVVIDEGDGWSANTGRRRCRPWWRRYLSFSYARSSALCMALQIGWRLVVSAGLAMLLFCVVTKPPHPHLLLKVGGVPAFELVEGVDATGVATNFFTFNSTLIMTIDNRSKFYGLHVDRPLLELFFGTIPLVVHRGPEGFYAWIQEITSFQVSVGANNKPMYGAGRIMQDMVESQGGLSLILRIRLRTSYRLLGGIMDVDDYHQSKCLLTLKSGHEDGLGTTTYTYNSTCGSCHKAMLSKSTMGYSYQFVPATQPINSLAFAFDGVNFGASDFAYSAYSMVLVATVNIGSLIVLSKSNDFVGTPGGFCGVDSRCHDVPNVVRPRSYAIWGLGQPLIYTQTLSII